MLHKETWRKDYWFLSFICSLVWFLYIAKCEFSSKLCFYIKDWSPSRGSGATLGLIFPEIFVSPLSEFEQHMYSSDPRPDTGSLMQLENREAVPQASQPPNPKPQPGYFNNYTTRRPRSEKPLQTSGSRTFLSFSCFSIANQEAVSRSAALLLRIKALALQKRPLFVLFALVGKTADMNGWTFTHNNVLQRRAIQASTLDKSATIREKRKEFGEDHSLQSPF